MVDHLNVSYLYKKRGVFYFTKRVPCDVKSYYRSDRIVICLKTKSNVPAIRTSKSLDAFPVNPNNNKCFAKSNALWSISIYLSRIC